MKKISDCDQRLDELLTEIHATTKNEAFPFIRELKGISEKTTDFENRDRQFFQAVVRHAEAMPKSSTPEGKQKLLESAQKELKSFREKLTD